MCKGKDGRLKFSAMEMISSGKTGQTSATGTMGVLLCGIPLLLITALVIFYFIQPGEASNILEFIDKGIAMLGIGAALLGTRKISGVIGNARHGKIINTVSANVHGDCDDCDDCDDCCDCDDDCSTEEDA